jgi:glutamate-1-semialdehyde 2,1-aminomutase
MQGAGGSFPASKTFLCYLREEATRLDALLIVDELMTSRPHHASGTCGKYGIKLDLVTIGKYLGEGESFGLFEERKYIISLFGLVGRPTPQIRRTLQRI